MTLSKTVLLAQTRRAFAIAGKDIRIYYLKGPVVIFGILFPAFLYFSFVVGRNMDADVMLPGLLGMVVFFTSPSISPAVTPMETASKTLERLMSCPVTPHTIILGDILASFIFGLLISIVPIIVSLAIGTSIQYPALLGAGIILAAFCFSAFGMILASVPTNKPSTVMLLTVMVKFPLLFISGIFIPLGELPSWGRIISRISPLTYFTDIARHCFQNQGYLPIYIDILALIAFTIAFVFIAMRLHLRTMPRRI